MTSTFRTASFASALLIFASSCASAPDEVEESETTASEADISASEAEIPEAKITASEAENADVKVTGTCMVGSGCEYHKDYYFVSFFGACNYTSVIGYKDNDCLLGFSSSGTLTGANWEYHQEGTCSGPTCSVFISRCCDSDGNGRGIYDCVTGTCPNSDGSLCTASGT